jgi:serine/threonine protein kinase
MTERFTLLSEVGRGGMGVVWKARDEETGSIVALKLLREAFAEDPDYLARFERELELARRIDSTHVVKVLGYGVRQKVPYLALEYVDGPSLHDSLAAHGPYGWSEAKVFLIEIALGLADAHVAGVIHRDVKPSNVLMGPDGVAKLTDFGIARGLDATRMTATSTMLGTPAYLAPEGPKDARSDLYSLGVIGYQLLAGSPPFVGQTYQEVLLAHLRDAPDLTRLPPETRPIIGWLLAKDPAARPQSARQLLRVLTGESTVSGGASSNPEQPAVSQHTGGLSQPRPGTIGVSDGLPTPALGNVLSLINPSSDPSQHTGGLSQPRPGTIGVSDGLPTPALGNVLSLIDPSSDPSRHAGGAVWSDRGTTKRDAERRFQRRTRLAARQNGSDAADPIDRIRRLGDLRDAGLITEDEYRAKKTELLGRL